jgi:drug/metabolite transporter (DMT)-like permease
MLGIFYIILASSFWALDTLIRYPLISSGLSATTMVFYEHFLLSAIFIIFYPESFMNIVRGKKINWLYFIIVGAFGSAIATAAFTRAFYFLNPSLVILLQKFQPLVAIILARIFLAEKIQKIFVVWAIVCLIGAFLISFEDILRLTDSNQDINKLFFHEEAFLGYILVAISVVGWGASTVFGKKLSMNGLKQQDIMFGRFIVAFLTLIPMLKFNNDLFSHDLDMYGKIALMVLISGLLAMYLYYKGLALVSARACALAELFFPFFAVVVNWLFLGKELTPIQILGGCILLIGSSVIQMKEY